jgi:hypothetical protein
LAEFREDQDKDLQIEEDGMELEPRRRSEPKGVMKQLVKDMGYQETDLIYEAFVTEDIQEYKDGFTLKTVIGAFFVALIMTPGSIFLSLTTGGGIGPAAQWTTVILFMEIARRSFTTLTKQEMYVLYAMAAMLAGGGPFTGFIWNQYLRQSPAAKGFGIAEDIPIWVVPPTGSDALLQRTFLHPDWLPAITLLLFSTVTGQMTYMGAGYLVYRITADFERLPFPNAPIAAQGATALAETTQKKETWRWRLFSIGAMIGLAYGSIYILIPGITGAIMAEPLQIIPIPFIDLTPNIGYIAPTATLAISTDLGAILSGFVTPWWAVVANTVESILTNFFLNPYLYKVGILHSWRPGMDVVSTRLALDIDFWMSVGVGSMIAMAVVGLITAVRYSLVAQRMGEDQARDRRRRLRGRGDIPIPLALAFWLTAASVTTYIAHSLVPGFPLWILLFYAFVWTPFDTYISARMMGLIGRDIAFPYIKEGTFILSGYKGIDIWFAPIPLADHAGLAQKFKEIELTGTKLTSFFKLTLFVIPINLITSFMFWQFIWKMNPIPSAAYPYAQKLWPFRATMQLLWTTATSEGETWLLQALKAKYILWGFAGCLGLYGITKATRVPELVFYGVISGFGKLPDGLIPQFIGACINRFYLSKVFKPDIWRRYAMVLIAGYYAGMGLVGMASISFVFIAKAVTQMPY